MTVRRWHWVSARENIFAVMNMSYISVSFRQTRQRDSLWTACMPAGPQLCGAAISNVRHGTPLFSFLLDVHGPLYSSNKYIGANTFSCMYQCMVASMQPIVRQDVYASLHTLLNFILSGVQLHDRSRFRSNTLINGYQVSVRRWQFCLFWKSLKK
jgi:hypothetical protein